jgi:hypothetical protein
LIVWGGSWSRAGGIYDPSTDTWNSYTPMRNAPIGEGFSYAIRAGTQMLIFSEGGGQLMWNGGAWVWSTQGFFIYTP